MSKILRIKFKAFSLAELMIVMLILTIILAATMPILSKRAKVKAAAAAAAAGGSINTTATEGGTCTDGTDRIAVTTDGRILTCMPTKTLGDTCDNNTEVGMQAVDTTTMSGTDNPYVHLVCIKD